MSTVEALRRPRAALRLRPPGVKRGGARLLQAALRRYVAAPPSEADREAGPGRVTILLASAWGMGGTIRTTLNLAAHLAERREVLIVSFHRGRDEPFFGAFPPGVEVVTLSDSRPAARPRPWQLVRRALESLPSVLVPSADPLSRHCSLATDLRAARLLRRRTGTLIGTRPGLNLLAALLAPPGMRLIGTEHMHLRRHPAELRRAMKRLYGRLDVLVALTERDREAHARHTPGLEVVRIPNTVRDMGPGQADLDAKVVVAAGRLSPQKGFDLLVRAWAHVHEAHPDWRLRIYGDGPRRAGLGRRIERLGLGDVVTLEGPSPDLGAELARASTFVLSSRFEGLPLVLLEAMSLGMAVVSFDCPTGPRDVVADRRNGLLVPPERIKALAAALVEVMDDPALRRTLAAGAVQTAAEYRMEAIGPQWDALLSLDRPMTRG